MQIPFSPPYIDDSIKHKVPRYTMQRLDYFNRQRKYDPALSLRKWAKIDTFI